jgi:hypothetical protein
MENLKDKPTDGIHRKYRHRLSPQGKCLLRSQKLIVMIYKDYNDTRADMACGDFLLCGDALCNIMQWLDKNLMMLTYKGNIINFGFIEDILPEGEKIRLKMNNGKYAIVTKRKKKQFKCRYGRYVKNNKLG